VSKDTNSTHIDDIRCFLHSRTLIYQIGVLVS